MPIEFRCDQCQRLLRVPDANAGAKARCPQCASVQQIPAASPPTDTPNEPFASLPSESGHPAAGTPSQGTPPSGPTPTGTPPPGNPYGGSSPTQGSAPNPFADVPQGNPFGENPYSSPYAAGYQSTQQINAEMAKSKVMGPAIGMIIFGVLGAGGSAMYMLFGVLALADGQGDGEIIGMLLFFAFTMLVSMIVIFGSARMIALKNYGLALTATILSFLCAPCSIISIAFSIWALVVLCDSNVKRHFS